MEDSLFPLGYTSLLLLSRPYAYFTIQAVLQINITYSTLPSTLPPKWFYELQNEQWRCRDPLPSSPRPFVYSLKCVLVKALRVSDGLITKHWIQ